MQKLRLGRALGSLLSLHALALHPQGSNASQGHMVMSSA